MFKKISFSLYILALLVLLPLASSECTMDDFLRCDREIQSKYLGKQPIDLSPLLFFLSFYLNLETVKTHFLSQELWRSALT